MKRILVLFVGMSMIIFAGCSLGPTNNNDESAIITDQTGGAIVPHTEDKEIEEFFQFIEKTIEEEAMQAQETQESE